MKTENRKKAFILFIITFAVVLACFVLSIVRVAHYNQVRHEDSFAGEKLFYDSDGKNLDGVYVNAVARDSTWTKLFDLNHEGYTEHDYQAYTYDFTVTNDTQDEVEDYQFKLVFSRETYVNND